MQGVRHYLNWTCPAVVWSIVGEVGYVLPPVEFSFLASFCQFKKAPKGGLNVVQYKAEGK